MDKEYKGLKAEHLQKLLMDADFIFTCVGNDNDLREVTFGDKGIFKTIKKNSVYTLITQQLQLLLQEKFIIIQKKIVLVF